MPTKSKKWRVVRDGLAIVLSKSGCVNGFTIPHFECSKRTAFLCRIARLLNSDDARRAGKKGKEKSNGKAKK